MGSNVTKHHSSLMENSMTPGQRRCVALLWPNRGILRLALLLGHKEASCRTIL